MDTDILESDSVRIAGKDIDFRVLLKCWRSRGEFALYQKYLVESQRSRQSMVSSGIGKPPISVSWTYTLLFRKIVDVFKLFILIFRCLIAPRNRILILNHTARRRLTEAGSKPFYLNEKNFKLKDQIIFEDRESDYIYPKGARKMNYAPLEQSVGSFVRLWEVYLRLNRHVCDTEMLSFLIRFKLWILVLRLLRPARAEIFVWYGKEPMIAACKELMIPVWDLQHGVIYEEHPIYNLTSTGGIAGSDYLRPEKCLVYGDYWREHLLKSGWAAADVLVAGYFPNIKVGYAHVNDAPYVLYTSQPHSNQIIVAHIRAISHALKARGWSVMIALHPLESSAGYADILSDTVHIAKFDSYDLLRNCMVHVSCSSTLLWEAMLFGKSSFVLRCGEVAPGLLSDLIRFGYGRALADQEFPEPFTLPETPPRDYFFAAPRKNLLNDLP